RAAEVVPAQAAPAPAPAPPVVVLPQEVTLFVYGWENVEPGPLSWAFPSLRAALDAVRTLRNAVEWCVVSGHEWTSVDAARASGAPSSFSTARYCGANASLTSKRSMSDCFR